jgi:2-succinyl-5-enolpyruvyl-6-hydroxy-3-cyclohexene-1-carboxylate synthase
VAAALRAARPAGPAGTAQSRAWLDDWRQAAAIAAGELAALVGQAPDTTVAWVYVALIEHLPPGALVYAANSMAVRDLDSFTRPSAKPLRAIANRGAAGIDGTLSSALGAAFGTGTPAVLVTGDLAFLHDLNGLGAAGLPGVNLTVLLFNDGGGGIFAHLPIAELDPPIFERYVLTPSGVDFAAACAAFGVPHRRAGDRDAFGRSLTELLATPGVHVIELAIDRQANTAAHRHYWSAVASRIR